MKATTNSGRALELPPVLLLGQLVHVGAQLPGVLLEERLALVLVLGLGELQEGVERDLRVDDDLAAARQVHDHVGPEQAVRRRGRLLLVEVAVLGHAGRLHGVAQRHFAPAAPRLRRAQRRDEVPGLLLQLLVADVQRRHPLVQGGVGALALRFHVPQPALVAGQGLAQRVEQLRDRLLALREVALGGRPDLVELGVGQGEELLVVLRQRLRRQFRERAGEEPALLLRPARRLRFGRARAARARRRRRRGPSRPPLAASVAVCSWAASSARPSLRIGEPALGQTGRARPCGSAAPGARQRRWRGRREPDDDSEDHGANVTTGCVNDGDRLRPCLVRLRSADYHRGSSARERSR